MDKYFYFRTVADQDDDDAKADSLMIPVDRLTGIEPYNSSNGTSADTLILYFTSLANEYSPTTTDFLICDTVKLTVTAGKSKQAIEALSNAMAGGHATNHRHSDGIIVVADDVTTTYLTSSAAADETKSAFYLDSGITACGAITVAAAWS